MVYEYICDLADERGDDLDTWTDFWRLDKATMSVVIVDDALYAEPIRRYPKARKELQAANLWLMECFRDLQPAKLVQAELVTASDTSCTCTC